MYNLSAEARGVKWQKRIHLFMESFISDLPSLSMRIVEYKDADTIRVIEEVRKETTFGEEVFINKKLSFTSIRRLCDMLNGLKQLLRDYCVTDYKVYATAILREAENRRPVLDLIHVNTGFYVDVVDMPQEIYYKHYLLQYLIQKAETARDMIMEIICFLWILRQAA